MSDFIQISALNISMCEHSLVLHLTLKEICAHVGNKIMLLAGNGIIVVTLNTSAKMGRPVDCYKESKEQ
jgi:hypothetical protein